MKLNQAKVSRHIIALFIMSSIMISSRILTSFAFTIPLTSTPTISKRIATYALSSVYSSDLARKYTYNTHQSYHTFRLYSSSSDANNKKARLIFLGTPDVAADSLKSIVDASKKDDSVFEVVGVVTQPPKRRKRRGKEIPSPVGLVAEELGIPVLCPEKAKDPEFLDELEHSIKPDICITAAYGQYLPKRFLAIPKYGTLNIHPSLLPRWRGASPVQRSLQAGDNPVGVSVLFTVSKMDAGPIVKQTESTIGENDQATFVLPHLFEIGTNCLLEAIPDVISGKITMDNALQQNDDAAVAADMIDSAEGELCVWKESAKRSHNKVRGFSMWPGTFMFFQLGDDSDVEPVKVKIIETRVAGETGSVSNEELTDLVEIPPGKGKGLMVVCSDGSVLELMKVQPVTKKAMDAKSFVNGLQGKSLRWVKGPSKE